MSSISFAGFASTIILACLTVVAASINSKLGRIAVALETRDDKA